MVAMTGSDMLNVCTFGHRRVCDLDQGECAHVSGTL